AARQTPAGIVSISAMFAVHRGRPAFEGNFLLCIFLAPRRFKHGVRLRRTCSRRASRLVRHSRGAEEPSRASLAEQNPRAAFWPDYPTKMLAVDERRGNYWRAAGGSRAVL